MSAVYAELENRLIGSFAGKRGHAALHKASPPAPELAHAAGGLPGGRSGGGVSGTADGAGQAGGGDDIFLSVPFHQEAVTVPRVSPATAPAKLHPQEGNGARGLANPAGPQPTGAVGGGLRAAPGAGPPGSALSCPPQALASRGRRSRGRASPWPRSSATTACTAAWPRRAAPSPTPTSASTAARPRRPSTGTTRSALCRDGRSSSPSPGPRAAATPTGSWMPSASSWDTGSPSWMIS